MEFTTYYLQSQALPILLLLIILLLIALLHFYWMFGGKWGFEKSLPTLPDGELLFKPGKVASGMVGLALIGMALFIILRINYTESALWVFQYGLYFLGGVFLLRAIGDFKYVGFFKKIRTTSFGKYDSFFYSPLCLLIGVLFIWTEQYL